MAASGFLHRRLRARCSSWTAKSDRQESVWKSHRPVKLGNLLARAVQDCQRTDAIFIANGRCQFAAVQLRYETWFEWRVVPAAIAQPRSTFLQQCEVAPAFRVAYPPWP